MKQLKLHTGREMPAMGLGTWKLDDVEKSVLNALDLGYKMIDTSSDYNTQKGIGKALKNSDLSRKDIYLVTKIEEYDDPFERTESNLKELNLDYVDLMLIHRPPDDSAGENLWKGLIKCKQKNLVRDIGVSNYSVDQIKKLIIETDEVPVVNQVEWTPFGHNKDFKNFCESKGIVIQAYSPLTRGNRLDNETLSEIAKNHNKTPAQIMLRWDIDTGVVPIPKSDNKKHQKENLDIFDFDLTESEISQLDSLNEEYTALTPPLPYIEYV